MPRKPRFYISGVPVHIVQRGHSREPVFFEVSDYQAYLNWVQEAADRYGAEVHAYVLMTNHIHILVTPKDKEGVSRMMQYIGRRYVPYINHTYGTSGTIWEGRYKASLIHNEEYLLSCMRYIELNPVRANMVKSPGSYRWSSYRANALGKKDGVVTQHPLFRGLGRREALRAEAYKALFRAHMDEEKIEDIRTSLQTGTPLGNDFFKEKVEKKLRCKVGQARRGRPPKRS